MLDIVAEIFLEELSYSGCLHVRHVRISPTYKDQVIELLLKNKRIAVIEDNIIILPSRDYLR